MNQQPIEIWSPEECAARGITLPEGATCVHVYVGDLAATPAPIEGTEGDREASMTQKMRGRAVTHEEAAASAQRLINSHFKNPDQARMQIPANPADDDLIITDYIIEQSASHPPIAAAGGPWIEIINGGNPDDSQAGNEFLTYSPMYGYAVKMFLVKGTYKGFDWRSDEDVYTTHWQAITFTVGFIAITRGGKINER